MCDGAGGCQFVDLWLGSAHLLSGHRANFANPRLAETTETTETTGQIGAGIENTHCYTLSLHHCLYFTAGQTRHLQFYLPVLRHLLRKIFV